MRIINIITNKIYIMAISQVKVSSRIGKSFKVDVNCSHPFVIDQPAAMGGTDLSPNPLEVFLASLSSCICSIGRIIAMQRRIRLNSIEVEIEGDIDKDFLMGETNEGIAGFTEIRGKVRIDANLSEKEKEEFLEEVERRCPIGDNIIKASNFICKIIK